MQKKAPEKKNENVVKKSLQINFFQLYYNVREVRSLENVSKKRNRKKRKRTRADYVRLIVFCVVVCGFLYTLVSQQLRLANIRRETKQCQEQIAQQNKEYEKSKKEAEYSSTDEFYEDKARAEGYVRPDETVFVIVN